MNDVERSSGEPLEIVIRDCTVKDVSSVVEIYNYWIRQGGATMDTRERTVEWMVEWLNSCGSREAILVQDDGNKILGWGIIKSYSDRPGYRVCCETAVYLGSGQVGKGLGSGLKRALIERCRGYGYHHLVAKIWADNTRSIEYNRTLGYTVVGIQKEIGHVAGKWRDVCIMQLVLSDVPPFEPEEGSLPTRSP